MAMYKVFTVRENGQKIQERIARDEDMAIRLRARRRASFPAGSSYQVLIEKI